MLDELLMLIKEMIQTDRSMIFIGLIDVTSSIEKSITEFIVLAADATHLMAPLNFFAHVTSLAIKSHVPFVYVPKKDDLSQACCTTTEISLISVKRSSPFFAAKIKHIKCLLETLT